MSVIATVGGGGGDVGTFCTSTTLHGNLITPSWMIVQERQNNNHNTFLFEYIYS